MTEYDVSMEIVETDPEIDSPFRYDFRGSIEAYHLGGRLAREEDDDEIAEALFDAFHAAVIEFRKGRAS